MSFVNYALFLNRRFNIVFPSTPTSSGSEFPRVFPSQYCMHIAPCHTCHLLRPSSTWFSQQNDIVEDFKLWSSTYALPSFHLLVPLTSTKIFHPAPHSLVPLSYVLPLISETRFAPMGKNINISRYILFLRGFVESKREDKVCFTACCQSFPRIY